MRLAARRTVGVIGATGVAIGAAMVLALPASAHTPNIQAYCDTDTGQTTVTISVKDYNQQPYNSNWVKLDDSVTGSLLAQTPFSDKLPANVQASYKVDGSVAHTFTMTIFAHDDADGSQHGNGSKNGQWDGTFTKYTPACVTKTTTTTPPPTTTTTTAPPTTTTTTTTTGSTTAPATTTSEAVVAAASTTPAAPGSGSLPFTGVNTALPLGIAGLLVVAGGGILFWLKFNARRRSS